MNKDTLEDALSIFACEPDLLDDDMLGTRYSLMIGLAPLTENGEIDLRPNFPPVLSRVRRIVIGLMRPCFASFFSSHIRRV